MDFYENLSEEDAAIRARRRKFIEEAKAKKAKKARQRAMLRRLAPVLGAGVLLVVLIIGGIVLFAGSKSEKTTASNVLTENENAAEDAADGSAGTDGTGADAEADASGADGTSTAGTLAADADGDSATGISADGTGTDGTGTSADSTDSTGTDGTFLTDADSLGATGAGTTGTDSTALEVAGPIQIIEAVTYEAVATADTLSLSDEIVSTYAIVIDPENDTILATKNAYTKVSPASMTKVLTILTAVDYITDLDDTFTITLTETDYSYSNDLSAVGFSAGETVTVKDLLYGTILPSGGDAAAGLAAYVAGDRDAFVELMNQKVEELGLSATTHMTDVSGLYNEDHYTTMYDMAMIMEAAINNELCREVLSAHTYTTSATAEHPDGITISNWFLRRIEDKDTGGEVLCAKTGFVVQSRNCAVSFGYDNDGGTYIIVTGDATSAWRCIYDHVALYQLFAY